MAEAPLSVYEAKLRSSMIAGVRTIARQLARDAAKRQLRDRGLKVSHFSAKEISLLTEEHVARHPEFLNEAATSVERWRAEGFFGKKAQSCFVQNLQVMHIAPRPEPQGLSLCETHAQNGAAR